MPFNPNRIRFTRRAFVTTNAAIAIAGCSNLTGSDTTENTTQQPDNSPLSYLAVYPYVDITVTIRLISESDSEEVYNETHELQEREKFKLEEPFGQEIQDAESYQVYLETDLNDSTWNQTVRPCEGVTVEIDESGTISEQGRAVDVAPECS